MAIAAHDIILEGFDHPFQLLDFQMELKPNAHGWAKLKLRMTEELDVQRELPYNSKLTIAYKTNAGLTGRLFCGILGRVNMARKDQYYEIAIELTTASVMLDRHTKQTAYQDGAMRYSQVVNRILAETEGAKMILATGSDPLTDGMLIQYNETDWIFIQRLASHLGHAIFPDCITGSPAFYFGTDFGVDKTEIVLRDHTFRFDERFYEQGGFLAGHTKQEFIYYGIETDIDFSPGTRAEIEGIERRILYKHAMLQGDQVKFTYDWGTAYKVRRWDNATLTGSMLAGTVVETVDERVRIALDIDAVDPKLFHSWTPITGNHFYNMPEVQTRVMLYMGSHLERNAFAVENVRENAHARFSDPNNRYFATQAGKELSVLPDSIGLGPREEPPKVQIADASGIRLENASISMQAGGNIAFQGDKISATAPSQVSMVCGGNVFHISGNFNVSGAIGSMQRTSGSAIRIPKSSVVEGVWNPKAIKQAAIASTPIGRIGAQDVVTISENATSMDGQLRLIPPQFVKNLRAVALASVPIGAVPRALKNMRKGEKRWTDYS